MKSAVISYTAQPVDIDKLSLQESEVSEVRWMDYEECRQKVARFDAQLHQPGGI